jgi:hypothetical protein
MVLNVAQNETLMKYLVYDDVTVDPSVRPAVADVQQYIYKNNNTSSDSDFRILALPKVPIITEAKKSFICCWLKTTENSSSPQYKDYEIVIDVFAHIDIWLVSGGINRVFRLMDEINDIFFFKSTIESIKLLTAKEPTYQVYDSKGYFCGYRMVFEGTNFTKGMCN